jgi:hypothetical protein
VLVVVFVDEVYGSVVAFVEVDVFVVEMVLVVVDVVVVLVVVV